MAGERAEGLRRTHSVALDLANVTWENRPRSPGELSAASRTRNFYLGLPDARLTVALAVMFVPENLALSPSDAWWDSWFAPGNHLLSIQARERAGEQSNALIPVDNVFGSPTHPVGNAEDIYGWLVSGEPDAREWRGRLVIGDLAAQIVATGHEVPWGRFVATATFTSHAEMTADEWKRVANRIYLRGDRADTVTLLGYPG